MILSVRSGKASLKWKACKQATIFEKEHIKMLKKKKRIGNEAQMKALVNIYFAL